MEAVTEQGIEECTDRGMEEESEQRKRGGSEKEMGENTE